MTDSAHDALGAPLPSSLPLVERRAVMPAGFAAGAMTCGIKASGRPDLMVIRTTGAPASAAAVFTTNAFPAAPVLLSRTQLAASLQAANPDDAAAQIPGGASTDRPESFGWAEAIVSTSGSANAATGLPGLADQVAIAQASASALGTNGLRVLCLSTGVIGTRLPVDKVTAGVAALADGRMTSADDALEAAAVALRTTDSVTKTVTTSLVLPEPDGLAVRPVRVSGIAKGVGMIHPLMATMLSVILTDAAVDPRTLSGLLRGAVSRTWNQLTVDGDTSTNDTVFVLASGASGTVPVRPGSAEARNLGRAIEAVARDLARQQAADGEGAATLITCQVSGATDAADARAIARSVVASSLVKAAVHGHDPNWGRVAAAAGNARLPQVALLEMGGMSHDAAGRRAGEQIRLDPGLLRIAIAGHPVFDGAAGGPVAIDRTAVRTAMTAAEVLVRLDLGLGDGTGEAFGCDLTEEYVRENSEYTT